MRNTQGTPQHTRTALFSPFVVVAVIGIGKQNTPKNGVILRSMETAKENPRNETGDCVYFAADMIIRNGSRSKSKITIVKPPFKISCT